MGTCVIIEMSCEVRGGIRPLLGSAAGRGVDIRAEGRMGMEGAAVRVGVMGSSSPGLDAVVIGNRVGRLECVAVGDIDTEILDKETCGIQNETVFSLVGVVTGVERAPSDFVSNLSLGFLRIPGGLVLVPVSSSCHSFRIRSESCPLTPRTRHIVS